MTDNKYLSVLDRLHTDAKKDYLRIGGGMVKSIFRPLEAKDFENAYLPISQDQGLHLQKLIVENNCKNIVEFGTSFGISTIYLAEAVRQTGGHVITTELLESKARTAQENISEAGLMKQVEIKIGDAMLTLEDHNQPIDFLFLDGWKDLYVPLFKMLESTFHPKTIIYADNMDMSSTKPYSDFILNRSLYQTKTVDGGKAFLTFLK